VDAGGCGWWAVVAAAAAAVWARAACARACCSVCRARLAAVRGAGVGEVGGAVPDGEAVPVVWRAVPAVVGVATVVDG
jgi:hypothetical protein